MKIIDILPSAICQANKANNLKQQYIGKDTHGRYYSLLKHYTVKTRTSAARLCGDSGKAYLEGMGFEAIAVKC